MKARGVAGPCALALCGALMVAAPVSAKPTGPQVKKCGKFKKKAAKAACQKQNTANRVAFNQIKGGKYVGRRGDGDYVDWTYCANGTYETITEDSYGRGISKGSWWQVKDAVVKQNGKWIDAVIVAGSSEVGIQRRGPKWLVAVSSLGRYLYPGEVTRTQAC